MKKLIFILFACFSLNGFGQNAEFLDTKTGVVNEYEDIFSDKEAKRLRALCRKQLERSNIEIRIITTETTKGFNSLDEYATAYMNLWKVGLDYDMRGIVIVVSKKLRKIWIETNIATVHLLSNEETKKIIDNQMVPNFKKDNYYKGVLTGIKAMVKELNEPVSN